MDRRTFLLATAGGLLAAPLAAEAQQVGKVPRVGYLLSFRTRHQNQAFWDGLHALGYIEGHNIIVERRYVEGKPERYSDLAAELVRLRVDVIVADGAEATRAARQATRTIPIVMVAADPVALGLIVSLGRPGGNITGLSTNAPELMGKRLQILKEALPNVLRVAVLANVSNPAGAFFLREAERTAPSLGLQVQSVSIHQSSELDRALTAMVSKHPDALLLIEDPTLIRSNIAKIAQFADTHRLPMISGSNPEAGILIVYGPSYTLMFRRTAFYVDKILKGATPAELPAEEPTKYELVINLKTAKALGLTIPQSLLQRADQVIE
jgi:putative tryptophan/tyrosine transport system substrate-binding protein